MRVLIAGSVSPFSAREEIHWIQAIAEALKNKKVEVDMLMLPFVNNPLLIPEQMMALRLLDVEGSCELLLAVGYPAFVLKHPHKRILLFSLASSFHEWFNSEYGILSTPQYQRIRDAVINAEKRSLSESERIICASNTLATKISTDYHLMTQALILDDGYQGIENGQLLGSGSWVVCQTTLEPPERIDLLLGAASYAKEQWKLNIFVPSASDVYYRALHQRIERLGLKERVFVAHGSISPRILKAAKVFVALHFATTRIPDSLTLTIKYHIPIVTATDCGAILEIAQNEINGLIVEPSAREIAHALDRIVADNKLHKRLSRGRQPSSSIFSSVDVLVESLVK